MPSIRANANTEIFTRTTNLPTINSFTWMGWVRYATLSGDYHLAFHRGAHTSTDFLAVGAWNNAGYKTYLSDWTNDWSGSTITTGVWYHYAWTRDGNNHKVYLNGTLESGLTQTSTANPSTAAVHLFGYASGGSDNLDGCIAYVMEWSGVALTGGQVQQQMRYDAPVVELQRLNGYWPMDSLADPGEDKSRRHKTRRWTVAGTITSEDGPPVVRAITKQRPRWTTAPAAPPAGGIAPKAFHHRHLMGA